MIRFVLAAPLLFAASAAFAADPVIETEMMAPIGDWSGFYAGVQLGGAFGGDDDGVIGISPFTPGLQTAFAPGFNGDFDGGAKATVTHSDAMGKAVIVTEKMPPPPKGMVYQLWLDQPVSGMVSAGVMPVKADQTVLLEGDAATAQAAGITIEPEGGSEHPTTKTIALFDFGQSA